MSSKKIISAVALLLFILLLMPGCANPSSESETMEESKNVEEMSESTDAVFTADEIASFNGEGGQKAYVIYNGDVYDVTNHPEWKTGSHGGNMAGTDITEKLDTVAPHGIGKLDEVGKIGKIEE
jgi:predicted heme/steroid binding protein